MPFKVYKKINRISKLRKIIKWLKISNGLLNQFTVVYQLSPVTNVDLLTDFQVLCLLTETHSTTDTLCFGYVGVCSLPCMLITVTSLAVNTDVGNAHS